MLPFVTLSTLCPQQCIEPVQFTCWTANDELIPLPWLMFFHSHLEGLVANIWVPLGWAAGRSGAGYCPNRGKWSCPLWAPEPSICSVMASKKGGVHAGQWEALKAALLMMCCWKFAAWNVHIRLDLKAGLHCLFLYNCSRPWSIFLSSKRSWISV